MTLIDGAAKLAAVKQGSGVLGKLCTLGGITLAAMAVGVCAMAFSGGWVAAGIFVGLLVMPTMFLIFAKIALDYAERNPLAASMLSGDFATVRLKELEIAQKNGAPSVPTANVAAPQIGQPIVTVEEPAQ
jgi:hypothetical protein